MSKVTTTIQIDSDLHREAKEKHIPLGKTMEDALRAALSKDSLIEDKKRERNEFLRRARELKYEIEELEKRRTEELEALGDEDDRMDKALATLMKMMGGDEGVDDKIIQRVSNINHIQFLELKEKFTVLVENL